jgi:hypothetical protein
LLHGQKRWWLYPPADAFYSSLPANELLAELSDRDGNSGSRPLECEQRAGDVLFLPDKWGHATLNVQTSIGLAYEFDHPELNPGFG